MNLWNRAVSQNQGDLQSAPDDLHRRLSAFNRSRLAPTSLTLNWERRLINECEMRIIEGQFVEQERRYVEEHALQFPCEPDAFIDWFEALKHNGPGQSDPLFPWLAHNATLAQVIWFVAQEIAGEAGFDDLVAMTQVKLPTQAKLELARNYWDEMGQGHESGMHGPMLEVLSHALGIQSQVRNTVWESLALSNLMVALASNRRYTFQSLGALGVVEQTAPRRAEFVNAGLKRLGIAGEARQYFALHATLDVRHSIAWNREVLRPLVTENPGCARFIAEGALMRLRAGARCFARYRRELWGSDVHRNTQVA